MSGAGPAVAAAPGKVVLWGEYAVLAGAPALVMAVDRYARCSLAPGAGRRWHCSATGYCAPDDDVSLADLLQVTPGPGAVRSILHHVLRTVDAAAMPAAGVARFDTESFHHHGAKLGLGSSAALTVATYGAVCRLLGRPARYTEAREVHRQLQGGGGSGLDVAAAWHGGLLRFQRDAAAAEGSPWVFPGDLHVRFLWSGTPASTREHLGRLDRWLNAGGGAELDALARHATALFEAGALLPALADYVLSLEHLDRAADLGIFSAPHRRLRRLAMDAGVVYKPCGAGGGDLGAAFAADPGAVDRFLLRAGEEGFVPLALETAPHGLEVTG